LTSDASRTYQRCTITVMDTSDPDITFDADGASSWVHRYDRRFAETVDAAQSGAREPELKSLVERIKNDGRGKAYDVVIGVSGGVDSTYLTLAAVRLGLRPLCVHFDSGWNSELAVDNIHNLVGILGLDLYTHVVDWREMRDLQLAFLRAGVANADTPTDHAFGYVAYRQARKYGVKHILSGSNYVSESILPTAWGYSSFDDRHLKAIHRQFGSVRLKSYPVMSSFTRSFWYPLVRGIKTHRLLNLMPYHYESAKAEIAAEVGWRDYGGKHYESVFTRWFQGYYLPTRFGFDKRLAHYSSLILSGEMSRDAALTALEISNYPEDLRAQDHEFIAKKLGVSVSELDEIVSAPPHHYSDYPTNESQTRAVYGVTAKVGRLLRRLRVLR